MVFTGCEKTDTQLEINQDNLAGEWEMSGFTFGGRSTNEAGGETYRSNFAGSGRDITFKLRFNTDGTYTSSGSYTIDAVYAFGGQEFPQELTFDDALGSGTYDLNGDELTLARNDKGEIETASVVQLTSKVLIFELQQTRMDSGQGTTSTVVIDGDFQLLR